MKLIKKMIAASLALALVLSMSGCYWEGKTKWRSEQLLLNELEEKYNEEFIIRQIGVSSARSGGPLVAYCSPKDDKELVFEVELYQFGDSGNYTMYDMYIQSIVRREMKAKIDAVLSKYYANFASEVYVWGLEPDYDSGITDAELASIVSFTEAIPNSNGSSVWIAIDKDEVNDFYDIQQFEDILIEVCAEFHLTTSAIYWNIVSSAIVDKTINEISDNNYDIMRISGVLSGGRYKIDNNYRLMHVYKFIGNDTGLDYVRTVDNESDNQIDD